MPIRNSGCLSCGCYHPQVVFGVLALFIEENSVYDDTGVSGSDWQKQPLVLKVCVPRSENFTSQDLNWIK